MYFEMGNQLLFSVALAWPCILPPKSVIVQFIISYQTKKQNNSDSLAVGCPWPTEVSDFESHRAVKVEKVR